MRGHRISVGRVVTTLVAVLSLLAVPAFTAWADTGGPAISTDQADYAPGSTVTLTGSGWAAGESVHVTVDDNDGQTWHYAADPTANDSGGFVEQFVLPDWFVANYTAKATDASGASATTTFTDSNIQVGAVNPDGRVAVSVLWTTFKRDGGCGGTTLNSGTVTTVTSGTGFTGTSGVGNNSSESLLTPATITVGGELYSFSSWTGAVPSTDNPVCISGSAQHGTIQQLAHYVDSGVAVKQQQTINFPFLSDKVYGDADFTVSATASSGLTVSFSASGPCTMSGTTVHLTGSGDCTVTATQDGNVSYYAATPVPRSFTITGASTTVTVTCPASDIYTGSALTPCTAAATGAGGLNQSLDVNYLNNVDAGTATASASYPGDANHSPASDSATFEISKAPSSVGLTCPASETYTGSALTPCTALATGAGGLSQSLTVSYTANTDAGTAGASASFSGDANHTGSSGSAAFVIDKAPSDTVITCPSATGYTGGALEPCSAIVTGAGLATTATVDYTDNTDVGTAHASASYPGDSNHGPSDATTTFDIVKAPSIVSVDCPSSVPYDGTPQTPCTASVTGIGGLSGSLTPVYSDNTNAGTASASASYVGDANHEGASDSRNFTIAKATSTVTLNCPSNVTYDGSAQQPCTAAVTGAGGLNEGVTVEYGDNTDAGTASASASYAGDANHEGSSDSSTFSIDKAPSSVTLSCTSPVTYDGSALSPCSAHATGAGALDVPVTVSYPTDHTDAALVTVFASYGGDANHDGSSATSSFTISPAASTTTLTCPVSVTYDGSAQTPCTASVTGAGGLSDSVTPVYSGNTDAGTADATATYAGDANHSGSADTKHFTIDPASSTVTVTCPVSQTYTGLAQSPCTATVTGAGGLSQTLTVGYSADHTDVGDVTASASYAGDANHTGSSGSKIFGIVKAPLTVTADDKSMSYGDTVPAPTYKITGYVNGETFGITSGVTGTPGCTTTGTSAKPAGNYPIACTIGTLTGSNYSFVFVAGTLSIGTRSAALGYTGNLFWSTGTATATTANVTLQGVVTPAAGGNPDMTKAAPIVFELYKSTNLTMSTPDATCTATTVSSAGLAACTITLGLDNWTVVMHMPANSYFSAPDSDPVVLTVYQPATDKFATGGGWVTDPSATVSAANKHGNFGFTVRYKSGTSPAGQAVYVYRGKDGYNYVVKSNSWQNGGLSFGANTVSFSAKCNVAVIDPATGTQVTGLGGGNFSFRVDAIDNGSPGSADTYAIAVYTPTGALYHQAGLTSNQLVLGGGNIVVHTK